MPNPRLGRIAVLTAITFWSAGNLIVRGTELTGPSLDPSGTRLYFSSQTGPGETFEVTGPFAPPPAVPALGSPVAALLAASLGVIGARRLARQGG